VPKVNAHAHTHTLLVEEMRGEDGTTDKETFKGTFHSVALDAAGYSFARCCCNGSFGGK